MVKICYQKINEIMKCYLQNKTVLHDDKIGV